MSLVERFYDPISGTVRLDGRNLQDLNVKWLRGQIGLVSQEPTLFATTIEENVAHGLIGTKWEGASQEEKFQMIKEACVKANADGFITKLPNGYQTMVGERGFLLSGGQKRECGFLVFCRWWMTRERANVSFDAERVAIARAIVSDPRILLLDEATSALDTQSEGVVQNALDKAAAGRTTITIAHRLSTIKDADQIFVMGEGTVLERGTHHELLSRTGGAYARLVQAQKLREGKERAIGDEETLEGSVGHDEKIEDQEAMEKAVREEVPLGRKESGTQSVASEILARRQAEREGKETDYSLPYLFMRMGKLNRATWSWYALGSVFAIMTGMVYPAFGIVYGEWLNSFALFFGLMVVNAPRYCDSDVPDHGPSWAACRNGQERAVAFPDRAGLDLYDCVTKLLFRGSRCSVDFQAALVELQGHFEAG